MAYTRPLLLLLLLVYPLYIKCADLGTEDEKSEATDIGHLFNSMQNFSFSMQNFSYNVFNTLAKLDSGKKQEKANEKLLTMVSDLTNAVKAQSETIKEQGEKIKDQDQNIRDLRKSLDKRLRENDLKIEWALTDGTLAPKNTSGIMETLVRQEKMLKELYDNSDKPRSCDEIDDRCAGDDGCAGGVHQIYPNHIFPRPVYCNTSAGGGWTVIQRRFDGSVDFFRGWEEYANGFGDPTGEYWFGLRHIHALTQAQPMELYVGLTDFDLGHRFAKYALFSVSSEEDKFRLNIGTYSGNAGDSLRYHNDEPFSTKDQDNDSSSLTDCSKARHGAWWYKYCTKSNLNGLFSRVKVIDQKYMKWYYIHNDYSSMKASIMMIRPANFRP